MGTEFDIKKKYLELVEDEIDLKDEIGIKVLMDNSNRISFEELEKSAEKGPIPNTSNFSDEAWPIAIAYALITRYGLDYDEYVRWTKYFDIYTQVKLIELTGKESPELNEKIQMEEEKNKENFDKGILDARSKKKFVEFIDYLDQYEDVMVPDDEGDFHFLNGNYSCVEDIDKHSAIEKEIEKAKAFADNTFQREYKSDCCPSYIACSNNIERVFYDSADAFFVKIKPLLSQINYSIEEINGLKNDFLSLAKEYGNDIKETLDEQYFELVEDFKAGAEELDDFIASQGEMRFIGGGFGVKGAIKGVIGAQLAQSIYDGYRNGKIRHTGESYKNKFESMANDIYLGQSTWFNYMYLVGDIQRNFINTNIISKLFKISIGQRLGVDDAEYLMTFSRKLPTNEMMKLTEKIYRKFPLSPVTYAFAVNNICNIEPDILPLIKRSFIDIDEFEEEAEEYLEDWSFETKQEGYITYLDARKYFIDEAKKAAIDKYNNYSYEEKVGAVFFRTIFKYLLKNQKLCKDNFVNKYVYDFFDELFEIDGMSAETIYLMRGDYCLYNDGFIMVLDDKLLLQPKNEEVRIYKFSDINNMLVTSDISSCGSVIKSNPKISIIKNNTFTEEVWFEFKEKEFDRVSILINELLVLLKNDNTLPILATSGYGHEEYYAFCEACKNVFSYVKPSIFESYGDCPKCHNKKIRLVARLYRFVDLKDDLRKGAKEFDNLLCDDEIDFADKLGLKRPLEIKKQLTVKFCPFCGKSIKSEVKFCNYCGNKL